MPSAGKLLLMSREIHLTQTAIHNQQALSHPYDDITRRHAINTHARHLGLHLYNTPHLTL